MRKSNLFGGYPFAVFAAGIIGLLSACSSETGDGGDCLDTPDCASCAQDGECCEFSVNCQPGSICNLPSDELYDDSKPEATCQRVVCSGDGDCPDGKFCSLEKVC